MIVSVFLPWLAGISGWKLMFSGQFGTSHNFLFSYSQGLFFFSGFLALLFGLLVAIGGVMRIVGWENGEVLILLSSIFSIIVVTVNIAMVYAKGVSGYASPGGGHMAVRGVLPSRLPLRSCKLAGRGVCSQ